MEMKGRMKVKEGELKACGNCYNLCNVQYKSSSMRVCVCSHVLLMLWGHQCGGTRLTYEDKVPLM